MQSPWGRTRPGVLEEQQGGLRVWRTVSEGQEEGKEDTEGTEQVMQSLVGCGKKFKLVASFCDPVDFSPPGFSIHGISQAKILNGLLFPSPGDLPNPRSQPAGLACPALAGGLFTTSANWEAP